MVESSFLSSNLSIVKVGEENKEVGFLPYCLSWFVNIKMLWLRGGLVMWSDGGELCFWGEVKRGEKAKKNKKTRSSIVYFLSEFLNTNSSEVVKVGEN